jgi:hypothetical protein
MSPLAVSAANYSLSRYRVFAQRNEFVQIIVYLLLAFSIVGSLAAAWFCISRGGNLSWVWYFGVYVKIACKFNR